MSLGPSALPRGPLRVPQRQPRRQSRFDSFAPGRSIAGDEQQRWAGDCMETQKPLMAAQMRMQDKGGTRQQYEHPAWFAHRKRACRFLALVAVTALVVVALVVGIALSLKGRETPASASDGLNSSQSAFPVGSFSLRPTLIHRSGKCVSRPSAWRCDSVLTNDASVVLHMTVSAPDPDNYTISSKPTRYFPTLTNVAMGLLSASQPDERLVFTVPLNMTIDSAGARCTIRDVKWSAALYTRRRGEQDVAMSVDVKPRSGPRSEVEWPGDAQLALIKTAATGGEDVACVDNEGENDDGRPVNHRSVVDGNHANNADSHHVGGTGGTCECIYSNN